jgi:hypothetical protein
MQVSMQVFFSGHLSGVNGCSGHANGEKITMSGE